MTGSPITGSGPGERPGVGPPAEDVPGASESAEWTDPRRAASASAAPVLSVEGFEGPLDWLVEMARARKLDLARLSILALIEAFAAAMQAAFSQRLHGAPAPAGQAVPDVARWAGWTVLAAQLTELRSKLLLPPESPEAKSAEAEAEALRRTLLDRAAVSAAADWLERQPQLGHQVFARGAPEAGRGGGTTSTLAAAPDPDHPMVGDITDLLRACLVALRLPPGTSAVYQPKPPPWWTPGAAMRRMLRLLEETPEAEPPHNQSLGQPQSQPLTAFLPALPADAPHRDFLCRGIVAGTFLAGLELTREGRVALEQKQPWQTISVRRAQPVAPAGADGSPGARPDDRGRSRR